MTKTLLIFLIATMKVKDERTFRADRGNMSRPTTEEVYQYRAYVDQEMKDLFE